MVSENSLNLKIELISEQEIDFKVLNEEAHISDKELPDWRLVCSGDNKFVRDMGIDMSMVDFSNNNVIIAFGSEIESIRCCRKAKFPYNAGDYVNYTMNEDVVNKVYIYRIEKRNIRKNPLAYPIDEIWY